MRRKRKRKSKELPKLTSQEKKLLNKMFKFFKMIEGFYKDVKDDVEWGKAFKRMNKLKRKVLR